MQYQPPTHVDDTSRAPPSLRFSLTLAALLLVGLWSPTAALGSVAGLVVFVAATGVVRSGVTLPQPSPHPGTARAETD